MLGPLSKGQRHESRAYSLWTSNRCAGGFGVTPVTAEVEGAAFSTPNQRRRKGDATPCNEAPSTMPDLSAWSTPGIVLGSGGTSGIAVGAIACNLDPPAACSEELPNISAAPMLAFLWLALALSSPSGASLICCWVAWAATTARTGFFGVLGHESRRLFKSEFGLAGEVIGATWASCAEADACVDAPAPPGVLKR